MTLRDGLAIDEPAQTRETSVRAGFSSRRAYAQTFAATGIIRILGVLSGVLAARLLGPTGRGELAVIIFLPMMLVPLGEVELPRSLAYEVSRLRKVPDQIIATAFWLALLLGSIQASLFALALPHYLPADKIHLLAASRWFMLYLPAAYVTATLLGSDQGKGLFGRFSIFLALPGAFYVAIILGAWNRKMVSPTTFAGGVLVGVLVVAALRMYMDWKPICLGRPEWLVAKRLLIRGFRYYLPAVASFLLSRADMFILVRIAPTEAIGLYAVAQAIALGQIGAVNPFIQVGFSAVAGEIERGKALEALARHFRLAQFAVISIGLLTILVCPWLIRIMFGERFSGAVFTAYLLVGSTMMWGVEQVLEQGLRAADHPRPGIISNLLGLAVLCAVGIPATRYYGIVGLASASLAAQLVNLTVLVAFCTTTLGMSASSLWAFSATNLGEVTSIAASVIRQKFAGSKRSA